MKECCDNCANIFCKNGNMALCKIATKSWVNKYHWCEQYKRRIKGQTHNIAYKLIPIEKFERSKSKGTYFIIDVNAVDIQTCDIGGHTIDEVLELREAEGVYVMYKEKAPAVTGTKGI